MFQGSPSERMATVEELVKEFVVVTAVTLAWPASALKGNEPPNSSNSSAAARRRAQRAGKSRSSWSGRDPSSH